MTTRIAEFEGLLRQATCASTLGPLLRALGFDALEPPLAAETAGSPGVGPADGVARAGVVGRRDGMLAVLLELEPVAAAAATAGVLRLARRIRGQNPALPRLFIFATRRWARLVFVAFGLDGSPRVLRLRRRRPGRAGLEALQEMAARAGDGGTALALRHARALDRVRLGRRFFREFRARRAAIAAGWLGLPAELGEEREQLALLLLCRLMFLYFLQQQGRLAGDPEYLPGLLRRWRQAENGGSAAAPNHATGLYHQILKPLLFGALNARPEDRSPEAAALGDLPYLNGGLFDAHPLERRFPELRLPDELLLDVFDGFLDRYRFSARDAADVSAGVEPGIDPEMLGRVFEGLMASKRRGETGTFYTPARIVDRLVAGALVEHLCGCGLRRSAAVALVRGGPAGDRLGETVALPARLVGELAELKVLDPACGSGAFLLGTLSRLTRLRARVEGTDAATLRREIVARSLHGVDVQSDAALLCALRLWLTLSLEPAGGRTPPPLPNLDRRVRQGDALIDPLDLLDAAEPGEAAWQQVGADAAVRRAVRGLEPLAAAYLTAEPAERTALSQTLAGKEAELAVAWLDRAARRLRAELAEARTLAGVRDLFGEVPAFAERARARLAGLERRATELEALRAGLELDGALPFFSFRVHFADALTRGFDLIVSNPPWVRAHRWPAALRGLLRQRFAVCRAAGRRTGGGQPNGGPAGGGAGQVDLALLFLERSLRLLRPGGTLAMLLPAKMLRSLFGAGARGLLLEHEIIAIEDHSLDQRSIFRASAFTTALIVRKPTTPHLAGGSPGNRDGSGSPGSVAANGGTFPRVSGMTPRCPAVRVTMVRRNREPLRFRVPQHELSLLHGDGGTPWLLAPPAARAVLRRMQQRGRPLAEHAGLRPRRGVVTGANRVLIVRDAQPKLGGLALIRAEGFHHTRRQGGSAREAARFRALIEETALRGLVRGSDIAAWTYRAGGHLIWCHDDETGRPRPAPRRAADYLARHDSVLRARSGWRPGLPLGAVFRIDADTLRPKVAWQDLAATLEAVALPAAGAGGTGPRRPPVPLNTVYFLPAADQNQALILAALLNSLPLRTFARAIAERAKDARFRFFAWTIALLPLPRGWDRPPLSEALLRISRAAHQQDGATPALSAELDHIVAAAFGLSGEELAQLAAFHHWLGDAR